MPVQLGAEEQRSLCQIIVDHVVSGPRERPVIEYLFQCSIDAKGKTRHISEVEVAEHVWGNVESHGAARTVITRLRRKLEEFFAHDPVGRRQGKKVLIPQRTYFLAFAENSPPPMPSDLVKSFWSPYYSSDQPVRFFYPEPEFFVDSRSTHFHNPDANHADGSKYFSYLGLKQKPAAHFGFVPSGIVQAMVFLFECFQRPPRAPATASPLRPSVPLPQEDEDIIVLGTPSTLPHLAELEASSPLRTGKNEVTFKQPGQKSQTYCDGPLKKGDEDLLVAWAVLTRRAHRYQGRTITVLAASNGRAVEALASFLTRQPELETLAKAFATGSSFPDRFQVLFEVQMLRTSAEPRVDQVRPEKVLNLDPQRANDPLITERPTA
jgi:hypothetical protein